MRLHRLTVSAVGPFPETEHVDFDALADAGVYLLTGDTGSGKTTVLDAVSYAIFGEIPRRTRGSDVVSHHRTIDTTPKVVLEATVGGERLRITRSPEHERPAKAGSGTARQGQSLLVERHADGEWTEVSGRWTEGNRELERLVGMTAGQFNQVVMLPQGDFSRFLDAKVEERRELLQNLFPGTDLRWLEQWLKDEARAAANAREEKQREISDRFQRVHTEARFVTDAEGADEEDAVLPELAEPGPALIWIDSIERRLEQLTAERDEKQRKATETWTTADLELKRLERQAELVGARRKAEQEKTELESRAGWRKETGTRVAEARRAESVRSVHQAAVVCREATKKANRELNARRAALDSNELTSGTAPESREALQRKLRSDALKVDAFIRDELPGRKQLEEAVELHGRTIRELSDDGPRSDIGRAAALVEGREKAVKDAVRELVGIREARTRGMAATLAEELEPDEPCPVCGSTEHPSPAQWSGTIPGKREEQDAERRETAARKAERKAREQLGTVRQEVAEREAIARTGLARDTEALAKLRRKETALAGEHGDISDRLERLEHAADLLRDHGKAEVDAASARREADRMAASAAEEARARGFDSVESAMESALDHVGLGRLERQIGEYDNRLAGVNAKLEDQLAQVDPEQTIDLEPAKTAADEAGRTRDEATRASGLARRHLENFRAGTAPIPDLYDELTPLREAAACAAELERLASGSNSRRMKLSIFVLATRLRQVIDVANRHLAGMTDSRYALVYSGDVFGGGSAGLGIEVMDAYTSETRPTGTLSGGEKFCAALSLALGLAEVVQMEAGGRSLETLFIDEGFGTLDARSLDQVMDVIDSLREGGRSVGLVSHVEELRDRIPAQIQVTGGRDGSTLELTSI